ncbi:MAG: hypothetical protein AVO35_09930 [Candidatus Aegiribacteria sp. MLS_C]|nr:MAG: hypothetical protein AVO35_09930 [Candidatus Aegiribacteria sp. MLS_C]
MPVAKVTEISSTSQESFEDAIRKGLERAARTLNNIRGAWIKEFNIDVEDNRVSRYRVDMKVTFVLDD